MDKLREFSELVLELSTNLLSSSDVIHVNTHISRKNEIQSSEFQKSFSKLTNLSSEIVNLADSWTDLSEKQKSSSDGVTESNINDSLMEYIQSYHETAVKVYLHM